MADFSSEYYRLKLEYDRTGSEAVKKQILEIEHEYWVQRDKEWAIEKEKIKKRRILEYNTFFQNNCHCISTLANYFQLESLYFPFPIFQSEDQLTHSARMVKTAIEEYDYNYPKTEKVIAYAQSGGKSIFFDRVKAGSNLLGGTNETGFMMTESGVYIHDTGEDTESIFIPYEDIYIFSFVRYNSKEYIYLNESIMFFSLGSGDEKKTIEWCLDFVKLLNHLKEIKLNRNKSFININNNISVRLPPRLSKKDKQVIECFIKKIKSQYLFSSCVYFADKSDKSIKKIESATDAYGIWDFRDGIIFCYDDTILGGAEDGFYVTDTRIYIHNKGGEKISIPLDELRNIKVMERYEKCLLWINYGEVDAIRIKTERIDRDDIYKIAELIKIIKDNFYDFSSEKELLKQMPNNDYETENDNARKRRIAESNKIKNEVKQDEAKMEEFETRIEQRISQPCWIMDILPMRVPAKNDAQYSAVEHYYRHPDRLSLLHQKQAEILLKLNCYNNMSVSFDSSEWQDDPDPEWFVAKLKDLSFRNLRVLFPRLQILIDLAGLPAQYDRIVMVVNIYQAQKRGQHFGMIRNAFIRLVDARTNAEMCRYDLTENYSGMTAMIFGEIYRHNGEWKFNAIGQGTYDAGIGDLAQRYV